MGKGFDNTTLHHMQKLISGVNVNMKGKEPKVLEENIFITLGQAKF